MDCDDLNTFPLRSPGAGEAGGSESLDKNSSIKGKFLNFEQHAGPRRVMNMDFLARGKPLERHGRSHSYLHTRSCARAHTNFYTIFDTVRILRPKEYPNNCAPE